MKNNILLLTILLSYISAKSQWTIIDTLYTSAQCTVPIPYKAEVEFLNEDTAYYFYNQSNCSPSSWSGYFLYRTTNSYLSWSQILTDGGIGAGTGIGYLKFINASTGFLTRANGGSIKFSKTVDAGNSWWNIHNGTISSYVFDVFFTNSDTAYAITTDKIIFKMHNDSLHPIDTLNFSDLYGPKLYFTNNNYGYIRAQGGYPYNYSKILRSISNGTNWIISFSDSSRNFLDFAFCADSVGYLASDTGIFKTTDAGNTWNLLNTQFRYCPNISILNCNEIFAVGSQNFTLKLFKSNDGGLTWNEEILPANIVPYKIKMVNNYLGFIHGGYASPSLYNNIILKTTTGGTNDVPDINIVNETEIYPNPTTGYFEIKCSNCLISTIEIFDIMGKNIFSTKLHEEETGINTTLNSGIYFVKLKMSNGVLIKKLIVESR